jgi:hypothetical protein
MRQLRQEVAAHFVSFSSRWRADMDASTAALASSEPRFLQSYLRLTSLQSWRAIVLAPSTAEGALSFFLEAQNDGLVSHVMARLGSWRVALQSLRSCIENVLVCAYYMDHPVERELWEQGRHRIGFTALHEYLGRHPRLSTLSAADNGLEILFQEYTTLSRAVHGSAASFRMTQTGNTLLWAADSAKLGQWATREARTILGINLLMLSLFRDRMSGAAHRDLRKAVSFAVPVSRHARIRQIQRVSLFAP